MKKSFFPSFTVVFLVLEDHHKFATSLSVFFSLKKADVAVTYDSELDRKNGLRFRINNKNILVGCFGVTYAMRTSHADIT